MKVIKRSFPKSRLRRTRMRSFSRRMVSENHFTINDVIWPVFLSDDEKSKTQTEGSFILDLLIKFKKNAVYDIDDVELP